MPDPEATLEALMTTIRRSPKYRSLSPDLIRRVGARELARPRSARCPRSFKEAIDATRGKLHQVAGAYWDGTPPYAEWLATLSRAHPSDPAAFRDACRRIMGRHASTRERLALLDRFYATTLGDLGPIGSVLDIACGLHPLAIPWMPLAVGADYHAIDIYEDLAGFLADVMALLPVRGRAEARDVLSLASGIDGSALTGTPYDVAFLLKTLPCLEQIERGAGRLLLEAIPARTLIVSFPAQTLGGRRKGMATTYEERFREMNAGRGGSVERFEFPSELVFRLSGDGSVD